MSRLPIAQDMKCWSFFFTSSFLLLAANAQAAEESKISGLKFTGSPSCASTSCHGGGTNHNESLIYERRDPHAVSCGILNKGTSLRMAEVLGIKGNVAADARCNVCHAPMQGVAPEHLVKDLKPDLGVGCESCHGPAENWLRFHTRPDVNFQQIVATGMRDLNDIYGRANTCVACHLNLDEELRKAGHPELYFELDGQGIAQPRHYHDVRPSLGPRSWLTGQAAALREVSWKLALKKDDQMLPRWKALVWLLQKTELGLQELPKNADFSAMQTAADGLAKKAALKLWTPDGVEKQLKEYVSLYAEFADVKADRVLLRRQAEVLVPAIDRLWREHKKTAQTDVAQFEAAFNTLHLLAMDHEDFEPSKFSSILGKLQLVFAGRGTPVPSAPKAK